jgi:hypothetical protein
MEKHPYDWQLPGKFVFVEYRDRIFFDSLQWMKGGEFIRDFYVSLKQLSKPEVMSDVLDILKNCGGIENITLSNFPVELSSDEIEACLTNIKTLMEAMSENPKITRSVFAAVIVKVPLAFMAEESFPSFLKKCPNLSAIQFSHSFNEYGIKILSSLNLKFPITIKFASLQMSQENVSGLTASLSSSNISTLSLQDVKILPESLNSLLSWLSQNKEFQELRISYRHQVEDYDEFRMCIQSNLNKLSLRKLSFECPTRDKYKDLFRTVSQLSNLEELIFSSPFQDFGNLSQLRNLQRLHLNDFVVRESRSEFSPPESLLELRIHILGVFDASRTEDSLVQFLKNNKSLVLFQTNFLTANMLKDICVESKCFKCLLIDELVLKVEFFEVLAKALMENCSLSELGLLHVEMSTQDFSLLRDCLKMNSNLEALTMRVRPQDSKDTLRILETVCRSNSSVTSLTLEYLPNDADLTVLNEGDHKLLEVDLFLDPPNKFSCAKLEENRKQFKEEARISLVTRTSKYDQMDENVLRVIFEMAGLATVFINNFASH